MSEHHADNCSNTEVALSILREEVRYAFLQLRLKSGQVIEAQVEPGYLLNAGTNGPDVWLERSMADGAEEWDTLPHEEREAGRRFMLMATEACAVIVHPRHWRVETRQPFPSPLDTPQHRQRLLTESGK